jgi:uncharacterized protein YbbC (DUF1343 family)
MKPVKSGLESLLAEKPAGIKTKRSGLILHPASVTSDLTRAAEALINAGFNIERLFGPQHGALGEKQDNMIESGFFKDAHLGLPVYSLYGDVRKPTPEMLEGIEQLIFDLQDVGVRVYTFVWTMALAMEACAECGVKFIVLDRPNPVGGEKREGPLLRKGFESFVGLHPVPLRHGFTTGELANWLNEERGIHCDLTVIPCEGLSRKMLWQDTGLPFIMPSPNLPTIDSCIVYPGMVLFEGTNLSEGRGTTRPFEIFGAPWLDNIKLIEKLKSAQLPGVVFRPLSFEPTFQKYKGQLCFGAQIHVSDPFAFAAVRTAVEILTAVKELNPDDFMWRTPPYEYEEKLFPIDILWGSDSLRTAVDQGRHTPEILAGTEKELRDFSANVTPYLLY